MDKTEFDMGAALNAIDSESNHRITIYFPNKDSDGNIINNIDTYIQSAIQILTRINGGATKFPNADGCWLNDNKILINESTVILYSNITNFERFIKYFSKIKDILYKFGNETKQEVVMVEYFGEGAEIGQFHYKTFSIRISESDITL